MDLLTNVFKVLSDETRLRITVLLAKEELCVCQLSGILDISQPKISRHLSKLRDLGFVIDQRQEKFVYYRLNKENQILINLLKDIFMNINEFPQLVTDQCRISDKDKYLSQCVVCETE